MKQLESVSTEVDGYILRIGLNRPEKLNSFNLQMLSALDTVTTSPLAATPHVAPAKRRPL